MGVMYFYERILNIIYCRKGGVSRVFTTRRMKRSGFRLV